MVEFPHMEHRHQLMISWLRENRALMSKEQKDKIEELSVNKPLNSTEEYELGQIYRAVKELYEMPAEVKHGTHLVSFRDKLGKFLSL